MKIKLIVIGKTEKHYLIDGIDNYVKRIKRYIPFEIIVIPALKSAKNLDESVQKQKEGELLLKQLEPSDILVLLDDKGKDFTSREFSKYIAHKMNSSIKNLVFVVGGPTDFRKKFTNERTIKYPYQE